MNPAELDVPLVALTAVNSGRGMVEAGDNFYSSVDRAAWLLVLRSADLLPAADEAVDAVLARTDEPDMLALLDQRTERMVREAWARGMRPD